MEHMIVRRAEPRDLSEVAQMCHALWPEASAAEHAEDLAPVLAGQPVGTLPGIVLLAQERQGRILGFIEVDLRSHADGCNPSRPVGYIEGWYVAAPYRQRRVGEKLVAAAEDWARNQGCTEMASDAWLDAIESQPAHEALGFEIVDRC